MKFSELKPYDTLKQFGDNHSEFHPIYTKISDRTVFDKTINTIKIDPTIHAQTYTFFPDWIEVEKTGVSKYWQEMDVKK